MNWQADVFAKLRDREWHRVGNIFSAVEQQIPLHFAMRFAMRQGHTELPVNTVARWQFFRSQLGIIGIEVEDGSRILKQNCRVRLRYIVGQVCDKCGGPVIKKTWKSGRQYCCLSCEHPPGGDSNPAIAASPPAAVILASKRPPAWLSLFLVDPDAGDRVVLTEIDVGVWQSFLVDPDTGDRAVLTEIDAEVPDLAPHLAEMLRRGSPAGCIERLRKEAKALPNDSPEKEDMLGCLERAAALTGDARQLWIARAEIALRDAWRRRDGVYGKRRAGGRTRGAARRERTAKAWADWEAEFQRSIAGKDHAGRLRVRRSIADKMQREEFVDPSSGDFPVAEL